MKIIDLHTHILPGVDDGAADIDEALEMLRNAVASQVSSVVVTPHCNVPDWFENYQSAELISHYRAFVENARKSNISIDILMGMEVRATEELPQLLQKGKIISINNSRYLLVEFSQNDSERFCMQMLKRISSLGYIPLVAHPERYAIIWENPDIVADWLDADCHIQLTAGSIIGKFGRQAMKTSQYLLRHDLVACVASDAHGAHFRTNFLGDVYDHLQLHYPKGYAEVLMWDNPLRICRNDSL